MRFRSLGAHASRSRLHFGSGFVRSTRVVEYLSVRYGPVQKVLECDVSEVTGFPSSLAVTPDGQELISLGFSEGTITLRDAMTLEILAGPARNIECPIEICGRDTLGTAQAHAVAISPDGSMAVFTSRGGVLGLELPSLAPRFYYLGDVGQPRHVIRDRSGQSYYVSGEHRRIARLNAMGVQQALYDREDITALSLSRDEGEVLAITDEGLSLRVLDAVDLSLIQAIDLPFEGQVVVPMMDPTRVVIVGGDPSGPETSVNAPVLSASVDLTEEAVGAPDTLLTGSAGFILFGDGNEWTDIGSHTAIVPTLAGTVTIDTRTGKVTLLSPQELGEAQVPPCCDIASYPDGRHVVMANTDFNDHGGSLIVYKVDELE